MNFSGTAVTALMLMLMFDVLKLINHNLSCNTMTSLHALSTDDETAEKKSKEQIEAEKRAILAQRTPKLEIDGFDSGKLTDKAKELHNLIMRLESEKYDLEKRFKAQQYDVSATQIS